MHDVRKPSAALYLPQRRTIPALQQAVQFCKGCDLYKHATQAVFGRGARKAQVLLVGEQPGDQEDLRGIPFIGPAGRVLDQALAEAGIERDMVYITNAVKHFKFEERGRRRIHKKPGMGEIAACRPWLEAEMEAVQPEVLVALGASAAKSLAGKEIKITRDRGKLFPHPYAKSFIATVHPSSLLRIPDAEEKKIEYARFVEDLRFVRQQLTSQ